MKKKILIAICLIISLFIFLKYAKDNRIWPFGSSIAYKIPNSLKSFVYNLTEDKNKEIDTFVHNLKLSYYQIPEHNFLTTGGAIKQLDNKNILYVSENGEVYVFDLRKKKFIKNKDNLKEFNNIRDVEINNIKRKLSVVAIKEYDGNCGTINLINYDFELIENSIKLSNKETIWESEKKCNGFRSKISGSRVVTIGDDYYLSTGIFRGPIFSGIIPENFSQRMDSSFGKIIKINKKKEASIYALGFRNPQGLFKINNSEIIFGTDHSSNGGDRINLINKNNNYAWPCISYGKLYRAYSKNWQEDVKKGVYPVIKKINNDVIYPTLKELEDYCDENNIYTDPIYAFSRGKVGISQGIHYDNNYFKEFKDNIIVATLAGRSLFRFILNDKKDRIISSEQIYIGNRIRDLEVTNDGKLVALTDNGFLIYIEDNNKKLSDWRAK